MGFMFNMISDVIMPIVPMAAGIIGAAIGVIPDLCPII